VVRGHPSKKTVMKTILFAASLILVNCSANEKKTSLEKANLNTQYRAMDVDTPLIEVNEDYLLGMFDPTTHPDFVPVAKEHTTKSSAQLRKETYAAFVNMHNAAKKEGISLVIVSATRNFYSQKGIWESKWTGGTKVSGMDLSVSVKDTVERAKYILLYSSMPGTSRHHWGTDIDINNLNDDYFLSGQGKKEYEWLTAHAHEYGFCQPYSKKGTDRETGYEEEKWHWSYMPVSGQLIQQYKEKITYNRIKGFKGSGTGKVIDVIKNYVLGISSKCK
jgi:zinc D-Ala-D-Ala carboxypeptidase